ncbi:hypothetical protein CWE13_10580 [Aliidiomarina shirensis]|uniref:Uncharacterized protein n=1 Tax=Aliidiomarina shirensis TaxID=1048642 RepID=A0A432WQH5_9GAMM|nr:hypothetical protein [Aliidiomarina shirensis]RUO35979.1 hypothetical protein CWE13_10580 [Aliidiomarina shirensis]
MSQAYYPVRNRRPQRERNLKAEDLSYFEQAFTCLKEMPERVAVLRANLAYYQQKKHLPKAAKAAITRFEYLLAVTEDPEEMERRVMEDSYEGRKFRQMPLLLKGVCRQERF